MNRRTVGLGIAGTAVAGGAVAATAPRWRRWCLTWGATSDEVDRPLPGDELLPTPAIETTRAIWIDATPGDIWPWLVQMGNGRGGAYTYDWIENLLGLDMHSADTVLPQFQDLAVGDVQALGDKGPRMRVEILDPEKALVFHSEDGNWVWAFALFPGEAGTRLISRNRIAAADDSRRTRIMNRLLEPGSLVMERKMLLGIKERAERSPHEVHATPGG